MIYLYLQDISYSHVLYNTFGPLNYSYSSSFYNKLQTNNGTGKTMLLKTILSILIPASGLSLGSELVSQRVSYSPALFLDQDLRLSNSQYKKYTLLRSLSNKHSFIILDEPFSFLDITSIMFYKKKIISVVNKGGFCLITDCIKKTMLPSIILYTTFRWL